MVLASARGFVDLRWQGGGFRHVPPNVRPSGPEGPVKQTPEQIVCETIDRLLTEAGWLLQDPAGFDRSAALDVAVWEFPLPAGSFDYLLFVSGKAADIIEVKKTGVTLCGVADQSDRYMHRLFGFFAFRRAEILYDWLALDL